MASWVDTTALSGMPICNPRDFLSVRRGLDFPRGRPSGKKVTNPAHKTLTKQFFWVSKMPKRFQIQLEIGYKSVVQIYDIVHVWLYSHDVHTEPTQTYMGALHHCRGRVRFGWGRWLGLGLGFRVGIGWGIRIGESFIWRYVQIWPELGMN